MDVGWEVVWELFHFSIGAALVAGLVCPLVGCFLLVRRTGFYGVALPQFAFAGVALGFALLPWWIANVGLADLDLESALASPHAVKNYLLTWAAAATFAGLAALASFAGRGATETGRVAAAFAIASAATVLLAMAAPAGNEFIEQLLHGEILVVDLHDFETLAAAYAAVLAAIVVFRRDMLLVSYDRETARVLGKRVAAIETLLALLTGVAVATGVLIVGPVVLFGLLVLPPLAARSIARSMTSYLALSAALGVAAAGGGVYASFELNWPLGPTLVGVAALLLVPCWLVSRARG